MHSINNIDKMVSFLQNRRLTTPIPDRTPSLPLDPFRQPRLRGCLFSESQLATRQERQDVGCQRDMGCRLEVLRESSNELLKENRVRMSKTVLIKKRLEYCAAPLSLTPLSLSELSKEASPA